jgi:hypothetical protein
MSLDWLKGLGDGLGHAVCQAMESYRNPEEEARKHASHLKWLPKEFLSNLRG